MTTIYHSSRSIPILVRNNRTNEIRMEIENVHIAHIIMIFIYFSLNLAEYAECVAASFEGDIRQRGEVRLFPCLRFFFFVNYYIIITNRVNMLFARLLI